MKNYMHVLMWISSFFLTMWDMSNNSCIESAKNSTIWQKQTVHTCTRLRPAGNKVNERESDEIKIP